MLKPFSLALALLLVLHSPGSSHKDTHSALLGDLRVKVTAVRIASDQDVQQYKLRPRTGYHVVLVFLNFKNVANYPSCAHFDAWLRVKQGYEYPRSSGGKMKRPQPDNLPPTEESDGGLAFEIKDGMEPATLKLVRNILGEDFCRMTQHREKGISGPETVNVSLQGLPANAE